MIHRCCARFRSYPGPIDAYRSNRTFLEHSGALPVTQFGCNVNYIDQYWTLIIDYNSPVDTLHGGEHGVWFYNYNSGKCLSVPNASTADGALLDLWDCSSSFPDQLWYGMADGTSATAYYNYNSGKCISVPNASKQQGLQLDQWDCRPLYFVDQAWTFKLEFTIN